VLEENRGYYALGFRIGESDPEPTDIQVKVRRPGTRVRARGAAFAGRPLLGRPEDNANTDFGSLLNSPLELGDLPLTLALGLRPSGQGPPLLVSFIRVDPPGLRFERVAGGWRQAQLETVAWVIDPKGVRIVSDGKKDTLSVTGGAADSIQRDGLIRKLSFPAKDPGFYQVTVAIKDLLSGKAGNASGFFEVPDLRSSKTYVSALLLRESGTAEQAERERIFFPPFRFSPAATVRYECVVTPPKGKQDVTVEARITQGEGIVRRLLSRVLDGTVRSPVALPEELVLSGIPPGHYKLVVQAGPSKKASRLARSSVDFEVSP
jgi:hypothetical protein